MLARGHAAGLVDRRDPGVVEPRRDRRFAEEAVDEGGVRGALHELERRAAAEPPVLDEVDDAHPAFAQRPLGLEERPRVHAAHYGRRGSVTG